MTNGTYTNTRHLVAGDVLGSFPGIRRTVASTPTSNAYGTFRFTVENVEIATGRTTFEKIVAQGYEQFRVIG